MNSYTNEQLIKQYEILPEDIKGMISNLKIINDIYLVGERFNLVKEKNVELVDEVGLVILGLTALSDFVGNLAQRLDIDNQTAGKIAEEINAQIFFKVKESLKKVHNITEGEIAFQSAGGSQAEIPHKDDIIKEIEKDHAQEAVSQLGEENKKEETKTEPVKEIKYPSGDPYREAF